MASSVIHLAVASEINKTLRKDSDKLFIGSIAPDLSKLVGDRKDKSHFLDGNGDIPNMNLFLDKYKKYLEDDFVLGYYIHLYTDYLWFKYFMPEIYNKDNKMITKLDGSIIKCHGEMLLKYIYNDYTNMNAKLLDRYKISTNIFYNPIPFIDPIIDEIPMDNLDLIVIKTKEIIDISKEKKDLVFNIENTERFINLSVELILSNLRELDIV